MRRQEFKVMVMLFNATLDIFTAPVSGIYCFMYTLRVHCHSSSLSSPFEIVRNNNVEGSIFFAENGCNIQATLTGNAIMHVNQGLHPDRTFRV
jgi:hypothetical protein